MKTGFELLTSTIPVQPISRGKNPVNEVVTLIY